MKKLFARIKKKLEPTFTKIKKKLEPPFEFFKGIVDHLDAHDWTLYAAGLAFYALLAIAPLAVIAVAIGGAIYGTEAARTELYDTIAREAGPGLADLVTGFAADAADLLSLSIASLVSLLVLIWSSTTLFTKVRAALHQAWGIEPPIETDKRLVQVAIRFLRYRLFAALGTLIFGALFLALMTTRVTLSFVTDKTEEILTLPIWFWDIVDLLVAVVFVTVMVRAVYRVLPDQAPRGAAPWIGALVTGGLLVLGRTGVAIYLSVGTVDSAYGAAGALVIFLGWAYWSALVFLFGSRFTFALAHRWGRWPEPQTSIAARVGEGAPKTADSIAAFERETGLTCDEDHALIDALDVRLAEAAKRVARRHRRRGARRSRKKGAARSERAETKQDKDVR